MFGDVGVWGDVQQLCYDKMRSITSRFVISGQATEVWRMCGGGDGGMGGGVTEDIVSFLKKGTH